MGYFGNYHESAIQKGYVDREGDYEVMILGTKDGRTPDGADFKQVICKINAPGEPRINIFLTEGRNFDGNFTAFCDTFGLPRGDMNFQSWVGKRGWIHILLQKSKDDKGFTNMVSRWLLNDQGYVDHNHIVLPPASQQRPSVPAPQQSYGQTTAAQEEEWGDIPF